MHILISISVLLASFKLADWRNWERYYPTILYLSLLAILYEYISHEYFHLWELESNLINNAVVIHVLHAFIIYPIAIFIYLSNYPDGSYLKQGLYLLKWVFIFIIMEWLSLHFFFTISHHNGWSLGWSLFFDIIMFPMLRLHFVNPRLALVLSVFWVFFYLLVFDYI